LYAKVGDKDEDILQGSEHSTSRPVEVHASWAQWLWKKAPWASAVRAALGDYEATAGTYHLQGQNLLELIPEERAREGLFLAFQYPVESPPSSNSGISQVSPGCQAQHAGLPELSSVEFMKLAR